MIGKWGELGSWGVTIVYAPAESVNSGLGAWGGLGSWGIDNTPINRIETVTAKFTEGLHTATFTSNTLTVNFKS
tara:strand:+ start:6455 stop:6676 length:222 start_codon:yes stop_codon:yes gene_type:complete